MAHALDAPIIAKLSPEYNPIQNINDQKFMNI